MLKINFYVRQVPDEAKIPIYVRVTNGRAFDLKAKTKETCLYSQWNKETKKLKEKFFVEEKGRLIEKRDAFTRVMVATAKSINSRLHDLETMIENNFKQSDGIHFNIEWLKNIIEPPIENEPQIADDFVAYCDVFIQQKKHEISDRYKVKVRTIKKRVEEFLVYKKVKQLKLSEINLAFASDFIQYSIDVKKYRKSYAERNVTFIKTIAYHAETNGIQLNPQIRKIKKSDEKTIFQILTLDELEKIEKKVIKDEDLQNIRDWLLISCYSGQRISDFMRFSTDMIIKTKLKDGKEAYFLDFMQEKVKKQMHLPLHPKIIEILNKRNFQFPKKYSEQTYNELVKMVCQEAKIEEMCYGGVNKGKGKRKIFKEYPKYELVTSHIGRRSFASNNYGIIPTSLLMVATGHTTERMFLKYIGKVDNQQSNALANYFYE